MAIQKITATIEPLYEVSGEIEAIEIKGNIESSNIIADIEIEDSITGEINSLTEIKGEISC